MNDAYEIVDQDPGRLLRHRGRTVSGTVITFRSKATGVTGTLEVPDDDYNAAKVDELVRAKVATIDAVHAL